MPDHDIAHVRRNIGGGIGRSVINDDDAVTAADRVTDHGRYDARFVVCGDYDPGAASVAIRHILCHGGATPCGVECSSLSAWLNHIFQGSVVVPTQHRKARLRNLSM